jgi:hypothetical protein
MFAVYKKLTSPETSPTLGPSKSPDSKPLNANGNDDKKMEQQPQQPQPQQPQPQQPQPQQPQPEQPQLLGPLDSFSLCGCCSPRLKLPSNAMPMQEQLKEQLKEQYEFGHATHYKHNSITPRLLRDFELEP